MLFHSSSSLLLSTRKGMMMRNLLFVLSSIMVIVPWMTSSPMISVVLGQSMTSVEVVSLTDETFEHQTQASTGSTTGSWLIMFHSSSSSSEEERSSSLCEDCSTIRTAVEQLSVDTLNEKGIVVGEVDIIKSPQTTTRFDISSTPTIIFIHKGSYYTIPSSLLKVTMKSKNQRRTVTTHNEDGEEEEVYHEDEEEEFVEDIESITEQIHNFVVGGGYNQVNDIPIPKPPSSMERKKRIMIWIWKNNPGLIIFAILTIIVGAWGTIVMVKSSMPPPQGRRAKRD